MIRVLVVEDSPVVQQLLTHLLGSDPRISVVGVAGDGEEAVEAALRHKPDVITMDVHMPKMHGLEATRRIMEAAPTPIVIVTGSFRPGELTTAFHAIEAGAVAVVEKPKGPGHPGWEAGAAQFLETVRLMAEVKVVRRWPRTRLAAGVAVPPAAEARPGPATGEIQLVAIGASTGGPLVLQTILSALPKDLPVPVLIVQHMAPGFIRGFADWLGRSCELPIRIAAQREGLRNGHVYIAPDGFQMKVVPGGKIALTKDGVENGLCPSVSYLFRSVTQACGPNAIGVLLTGMGKDGAEELKAMKDCGAVTIAQDQQSSVVHGMPGEAIRLQAATYVLPPEKMPAVIASLVKRKAASRSG